MKTKKLKADIEYLIGELNNIHGITLPRLNKHIQSEIEELKARKCNCESASAKTIAKHLMDLETRVADLEKEKKCNCKEYYTPLSVIEFVLNPPYNTQTDYFLKAKKLLIEYAEKTMIKKGIEYTPVGDRFANFRPILGEKKTAIEKLIGYNAKHVQYCFMQENNMTAKSIDELLEHWGDVFNYNVLGLAMQNTDKPDYYIVRYADRAEQEKEIKDIVDRAKNYLEYNSKLSNDELYFQLLNHIKESNLDYIIYLFAKQLERLECK